MVLRESRAPYVLLLNPDTEATAGRARSHARAHGRAARRRHGRAAGWCGPTAASTTPPSARFPTPLGALAHFAGTGQPVPRRRTLGEHDVGEVDAVNGAFMLVRREALEQVGLLDEGYWLYMEDLDWCRRFWDRGWKVALRRHGRRSST